MKLIRVGLAAVLALTVGATGLALEKHDRDRDDDGHGKERHEDRDRHDHGRHEGWDHHRERDEHYARYEEHEEHHHRRIPDEHFRAHFGHEHRFVIVRPVIVAGHPRFQYDGYWFVIGRPLPRGWRYSDEVYVDYYEDNYYMCSPAHPGVRISIDIM